MAWNWTQVFSVAGEVLDGLGTLAAAKNAADLVERWLQISTEDIEEAIAQDVFRMSSDHLQMVDSYMRHAIASRAGIEYMRMEQPQTNALLSVYAAFHGAWTLRLYLASRGMV